MGLLTHDCLLTHQLPSFLVVLWMSPLLPNFQQPKSSSNEATCSHVHVSAPKPHPTSPQTLTCTPRSLASAGPHSKSGLTSWGPLRNFYSPAVGPTISRSLSPSHPFPVLSVLVEVALGGENECLLLLWVGNNLPFESWLCPSSTSGSHAATGNSVTPASTSTLASVTLTAISCDGPSSSKTGPYRATSILVSLSSKMDHRGGQRVAHRIITELLVLDGSGIRWRGLVNRARLDTLMIEPESTGV